MLKIGVVDTDKTKFAFNSMGNFGILWSIISLDLFLQKCLNPSYKNVVSEIFYLFLTKVDISTYVALRRKILPNFVFTFNSTVWMLDLDPTFCRQNRLLSILNLES
jgi:hypothetical protein